MISGADTVEGFLKTVSPEERALFTKLRSLLKKAHPKVEESMKYRMPTYMIGTQMLSAFNKQKNYLCLYVNPEAVKDYRKELGKLDCGKSCIRFTKPRDLPLDVAANIIKQAAKLAVA